MSSERNIWLRLTVLLAIMLGTIFAMAWVLKHWFGPALAVMLLLTGCTGVIGVTPDGTRFWYNRSLFDTKIGTAHLLVVKGDTRVELDLENYTSETSPVVRDLAAAAKNLSGAVK